jgi:hypothetical protein
MLAVGALVCIAALAGSSYASESSVTGCQIANMRLSFGPLVSEKTGQHTASVVLSNRLSRACTLKGYPTIALLDRHGRKLSFTYSHHGDQEITSKKPAEVRVPAGGSSFFAFNKYRCDVRALDVTRTLRVALPGSDIIRSVRMRQYPIIDYCGKAITPYVAVSPIERHLRSVFWFS